MKECSRMDLHLTNGVTQLINEAGKAHCRIRE